MIFLPDRYTDFRPSIATAQHSLQQVILPTEADASLWMSARPRLLGWHRPINWLPPEVVDARRRTKGALWGLDSEGNLIIVETKFERGGSLKDPFESLLPYVKRKARDHTWSAKELRAKWLDWVASEKTFLETEIAMFCSTELISAGASPYSLDHHAVWRFRSLFLTLVTRAIFSERYQHDIDRALQLREKAGDPPPIFASVVASMRDKFQLSSEGRKNLRVLQKYVDPSRVVLRVMIATRGSKVLRIYCRSPA